MIATRRALCFYVLCASIIFVECLDPEGTCYPDTFEVTCGDNRDFLHKSGVSSPWKRCAPKTCKVMPEVSNGRTEPASGATEVGATVSIVCDDGWELDQASNGSATPACMPECTFEEPKKCKKKQCSLPSDPNGFLHNKETVMEFGDTITVTCNMGYMRTTSNHLTTDPDDPCYVSYFQTCQADGSLTNTQYSCQSLQCHSPSTYDRDYLTCRGECGPAEGQEVARFTPDPNNGIAYLETVRVVCNAGYEWNGGDGTTGGNTDTLQCEWHCMYKPDVLAGCFPKNCPIPAAQANVVTWTSELPYRSTRERRCAEGFRIASSGDACAISATYGCELDGTDVALAAAGDGIDACVAAQCPDTLPAYANANRDNVALGDNRGYQGTVQVPCINGYIAVDDDPAVTYKVCRPDGATPADQYEFTATCGTAAAPCGWYTDRKCVPSVCSVDDDNVAFGSYVADAFIDAASNESYVFYDATVVLRCDAGYRPSTNASEPTAPFSRDPTINLRCKPWCELRTGDDLVPQCKPVQCPPIPSFPGYTVLGASDGMVHGESFTLRCGGSNVPQGSTTTSCNRDQTVRCEDGAWKFYVEGATVGAESAASCVAPVCGNGCTLQCPAGFSDPNGNTSGWTAMPQGGVRTVTCNEDYKATLVDAEPSCDDPDHYHVTCDEMCHERTRVCKAKRCYCNLALTAGNNFALGQTVRVDHNSTYTATCDSDFRVQGSADECETQQVVKCNGGVDTLQPCVPKPCSCNISCPTNSFPSDTALNGRAPDVRNDADGRIEHGAEVTVFCDVGYRAWPPAGETAPAGSLPGCAANDTYLVSCSQCDFDFVQTCRPRSCGQYTVFVENSQQLSPSLTFSSTNVPANGVYIQVDQTITVTCPDGYFIDGDTNRPSGAVTCQDSCEFTPLAVCKPVSCGTYTRPGNSALEIFADAGQTPVRAVGAAETQVEVFYGQSVKVSCDQGYRLGSSSREECKMEEMVTCELDGNGGAALTNTGVSCAFQPCHVICDNGTRYAGPEGTSFGCTLEDGCPADGPSPGPAPTEWDDSVGCPSGRVCTEQRACTQVRCRPYIPPANGMVLWPAGEDEFSAWNYMESLTVQCNAGYMPEGEAGNLPCGDSFSTTCLASGYWSTIQTCVPKVCHATNGHFSWAVPFNTSYSIPCPEGQVPTNNDPAPECQADCSMNIAQQCTPHTCEPYNHTGQHTVALEQTTVCDETIDVTCSEGYISTWSYHMGMCKKQFSPMCTVSTHFDHQEPGQCRVAQCPPFHSVDADAVLAFETGRETPWGTSIMVSCQENHGPEGIYVDKPFEVRCGVSDADEDACQWTQPRCERIRCPSFLVPADGGSCIEALRGNSVCDPVNNNLACGFDDGDCLGNATEPTAYQLQLLAGDSMRINCGTGFKVSDMGCDKEFVVSCNAQGELENAHTCETVTCPSFHDTMVALSATENNDEQPEWRALPFATDDRATMFGESVHLACLEGNEKDPEAAGEAAVTCQDSCSLSAAMRCRPITCDNHLLDFDTDSGIITSSTSELGAATLSYGQKVTIECEEGYELVETHDMILGGAAADFGVVTVKQRAQFPVPASSMDVTYTMPGDYDFLELNIPRGTWNDTTGSGIGPTATIFEIPANSPYRTNNNNPLAACCNCVKDSCLEGSGENCDAEGGVQPGGGVCADFDCRDWCANLDAEIVLAGEAVEFGPDGTEFSGEGVEIEVPVAEDLDEGNREFQVRWWDRRAKQWRLRETRGVKRVGLRRAVRARVFHFSTYAAFSVPAVATTTPSPTETPSSENPAVTDGDDDDNTGWIIGGSVGGALLLFALIALCINFNSAGDPAPAANATVIDEKPNTRELDLSPQPQPVAQSPYQQTPFVQPTVIYQQTPTVLELPPLTQPMMPQPPMMPQAPVPQPVPDLPPLQAFQSTPQAPEPPAEGVFYDQPWAQQQSAWPIGDPHATGVSVSQLASPVSPTVPPTYTTQPVPPTYTTQPPVAPVNYASQTSVVDPNFLDPNTM